MTLFASLIEFLRKDGLGAEAKQLDVLLNEMAWTTGTEFQLEFRSEMRKIKKSSWAKMSKDTKSCFKLVAKTIRKNLGWI